MALREQLAEDLKRAMKERDEVRVSTLRLLTAAIKNLEVARTDQKNPDYGKPLAETDLLGVIGKQIKMCDEAAEGFQRGGNLAAARREEQEKAILQSYLPRQLGRDEIAARVRELIDLHGRSFPVVMKQAMAEFKGHADGRVVNEVVRELTA